MHRIRHLIFERYCCAHGNAIRSTFDRLLYRLLKQVLVLHAIVVLKAWSLESIFVSMIVLGVLHAFLLDLIYPVVSFSSVRGRPYGVVAAFVQILFERLIEAIVLVPLEGSVGHVLLEGHPLDELILLISFRSDRIMMHSLA